MITCACPKCSNLFDAKSSYFGLDITCTHCSHEWILDTTDLTKYKLPRYLHISVINAAGDAMPNASIEVEYNYPIITLTTDSKGKACLTDEMIKKGLSDYISLDGTMDHRGEDYDCQKYIHLSIGSVKRSVDLSQAKELNEIIIRV